MQLRDGLAARYEYAPRRDDDTTDGAPAAYKYLPLYNERNERPSCPSIFMKKIIDSYYAR